MQAPPSPSAASSGGALPHRPEEKHGGDVTKKNFRGDGLVTVKIVNTTSGKTRRVTVPTNTLRFEDVLVMSGLATEKKDGGVAAVPFRISYEDDEGDQVTVTNDDELREAITVAKTRTLLRLTVLQDSLQSPSLPVASIAPVAFASAFPSGSTNSAAAIQGCVPCHGISLLMAFPFFFLMAFPLIFPLVSTFLCHVPCLLMLASMLAIGFVTLRIVFEVLRRVPAAICCVCKAVCRACSTVRTAWRARRARKLAELRKFEAAIRRVQEQQRVWRPRAHSCTPRRYTRAPVVAAAASATTTATYKFSAQLEQLRGMGFPRNQVPLQKAVLEHCRGDVAAAAALLVQ